MEQTTGIHALTVELQQALVRAVRGVPTETRDLTSLLERLDVFIDADTLSSDEMRSRLDSLERRISRADTLDQGTIVDGLDAMGAIILNETAAHDALVETLLRDSTREVQLSVALIAVLFAVTLAGAVAFRRRVLKPLTDLGELFTPLSEGDFTEVDTDEINTMVRPVFTNYNRLVSRLAHLEQQHRSRAETLQSEVRAAVRALLEQQRTLAIAERMAAVGETAAGVAHELRNPLAGILVALTNLRRDLSDPELVSRLSLLIGEIERMTRILNAYLASAQYAPEPARQTSLPVLVAELLALLRYQVPSTVQLVSGVPGALAPCVLPRDRIRQVLLNLVLNSVQALDSQAGTVLISAKDDDSTLVLSVCDDGPGFPAEFLDAGVHAFRTGRASGGGTGLGLQMVHRTVRDLGGQVRLANRHPHGASVEIRIPCRHG
jgi:signal transduction histidine kinase